MEYDRVPTIFQLQDEVLETINDASNDMMQMLGRKEIFKTCICVSPFNRHFSNTEELLSACQMHSPVDTVEPISDDFTESSDQFMISVI